MVQILNILLVLACLPRRIVYISLLFLKPYKTCLFPWNHSVSIHGRLLVSWVSLLSPTKLSLQVTLHDLLILF